jgi:hypothetical protein
MSQHIAKKLSCAWVLLAILQCTVASLHSHTHVQLMSPAAVPMHNWL